MFDVLIVGGGPAGLSAALTLGRVHRAVLLLDSGEGRNAPADAVHNFITRDGTPPEELRRISHAELASYPSVRLQRGTATALRARNRSGFEVTRSDGDPVTARRLLLATGLVDDMPGIEGVGPLWGRSAFHCPYCHGFECTGRAVAVIGSAPARVRLALQLSRFAGDVVLCTNGRSLDPDLQRALDGGGIAVRCEPVTRLESEAGVLYQIAFEAGAPLARDVVFIENAPRQRSPLAAQLGCAFLPDGCVEINEFGRTSVAGVYAAGDMAHRPTVPMPLAAVVAAAASGAIAAGVIDQDLLSDDFSLPNPFAVEMVG